MTQRLPRGRSVGASKKKHQATKAVVTLEEGWTRVQTEGIDRLEAVLTKAGPNDNVSFSFQKAMRVHSLVQDMCRQEERNASELYARYVKTFQNRYPLDSTQASSAQIQDPKAFLRSTHEKWRRFQCYTKTMISFFRVLDKAHAVPNALPSLKQVALECFEKNISLEESEVNASVLELIQLNREGKDSENVPALVMATASMYRAMDQMHHISTNQHTQRLQSCFLDATRNYYSSKREMWLDLPSTEYHARAREATDAESEFVQKYLRHIISSDAAIFDIVREELLDKGPSRPERRVSFCDLPVLNLVGWVKCGSPSMTKRRSSLKKPKQEDMKQEDKTKSPYIPVPSSRRSSSSMSTFASSQSSLTDCSISTLPKQEDMKQEHKTKPHYVPLSSSRQSSSSISTFTSSQSSRTDCSISKSPKREDMKREHKTKSLQVPKSMSLQVPVPSSRRSTTSSISTFASSQSSLTDFSISTSSSTLSSPRRPRPLQARARKAPIPKEGAQPIQVSSSRRVFSPSLIPPAKPRMERPSFQHFVDHETLKTPSPTKSKIESPLSQRSAVDCIKKTFTPPLLPSVKLDSMRQKNQNRQATLHKQIHSVAEEMDDKKALFLECIQTMESEMGMEIEICPLTRQSSTKGLHEEDALYRECIQTMEKEMGEEIEPLDSFLPTRSSPFTERRRASKERQAACQARLQTMISCLRSGTSQTETVPSHIPSSTPQAADTVFLTERCIV